MLKSGSLISRTLLTGAVALALGLSQTVSAEDQLDEVRANLQENMPNLPIDTLRTTDAPGLYELISQGQIAYVTEGGRYIIAGDLIDLQTQTNLTNAVQNEQRREVADSIPDEQKIIYPAEGETKYEILVLTDPSCPFCEKLHQELPALSQAGVEVQYLLTPRQGPGSPAFIESSQIMCDDDQKGLIDVAMERQNVDGEACMDELITQNTQYAQQLGMSGTPHIILPDGTPMPGFRPADELLEAIKASSR